MPKSNVDKLRRLSCVLLDEFCMRFVLAELVERDPAEYRSNVDCFSIPKIDIPFLVTAYLNELQTATTNDWCTCIWREHPDDSSKPKAQRRKVRIGESETEACPIHMPEGLLLGFFRWVFSENGMTVRHEEVKDAN